MSSHGLVYRVNQIPSSEQDKIGVGRLLRVRGLQAVVLVFLKRPSTIYLPFVRTLYPLRHRTKGNRLRSFVSVGERGDGGAAVEGFLWRGYMHRTAGFDL